MKGMFDLWKHQNYMTDAFPPKSKPNPIPLGGITS